MEGVKRVMKLLEKKNDLYKDGRITKEGYTVMTISSVFSFCCFLVGRSLYGKTLKKHNKR